MNKLVVRHTYVNGMAFDASGFRNHGIPQFVRQAPSPFEPSFTFDQPSSRITVRQNASLEDLIAVRAVVQFRLDPPGGLAGRYNLIEGHLCFALFVGPDGSLNGTILDADGNWLGASSPANMVSPATWHTAELRHDGINHCIVALDGNEVGSSYDARGPVGSVGPHGIAIGHWPEDPNVYTFEGQIRETEVFKFDPLTAAKELVNPCCCDYRTSLDKFADRLRAKNFTSENARDLGMAFIKYGLGLSAQVCGGDKVVSKKQAALSASAFAAFLRGDSATYSDMIGKLASLSASRLTHSQMLTAKQQEEELIKRLPLPLKDWQDLINSICLGKTKVVPTEVARAYQAARESKSANIK